MGRVVGPKDPMWLPDDVEIALQYAAHAAEHCRTCGTRPDEWAGNPDAYVADTHYCEGDVLLAQEAKRIQDLPEDVRPGAHPYLRPPAPGDFD